MCTELVVLTGDPHVVCVAFVDWVEKLVDVMFWVDEGELGVAVEVVVVVVVAADQVVVLDDVIVY